MEIVTFNQFSQFSPILYYGLSSLHNISSLVQCNQGSEIHCDRRTVTLIGSAISVLLGVQPPSTVTTDNLSVPYFMNKGKVQSRYCINCAAGMQACAHIPTLLKGSESIHT